MSLRRYWRSFLILGILACGTVGAARWVLPRTFRTPEAAAFDAYFRDVTLRGVDRRLFPLERLYLNIPPDARSLEVPLSRDLRRWARALVLFRDTGLYASSLVPADSLSVYKGVFDIRPSRGAPLSGDLRHDDVSYVLGEESCRTWPCHGGGNVAVTRFVGRYRARKVISVWAE